MGELGGRWRRCVAGARSAGARKEILDRIVVFGEAAIDSLHRRGSVVRAGSEVAALLSARQEDKPSLSEAIRRLVDIGLAASAPAKPRLHQPGKPSGKP